MFDRVAGLDVSKDSREHDVPPEMPALARLRNQRCSCLPVRSSRIGRPPRWMATITCWPEHWHADQTGRG